MLYVTMSPGLNKENIQNIIIIFAPNIQYLVDAYWNCMRKAKLSTHRSNFVLVQK